MDRGDRIKVFYKALVAELGEEVVRCHFSLLVQTNATLITHEVAQWLSDHRVYVGVSINGTPAMHDRTRQNANGKGSYGQVVAGIQALRDVNPEIVAGALYTISLEDDPVAVVRSIGQDLGIGSIDCLLPHASHDLPPEGYGDRNRSYPWATRGMLQFVGRDGAPLVTPYATWLMYAYMEACQLTESGCDVSIHFMDEIARLAAGDCESSVQVLGLTKEVMCIGVDDGSYQHHDTLNVVDAGLLPVRNLLPRVVTSVSQGEALTVRNASIMEASLCMMRQHRVWGVYQRRLDGLPQLCDTCIGCRFVMQCGGGLPTHRHKRGEDPFRHPSVYCTDLLMLFTSMRRVIEENALHDRKPLRGFRITPGNV
jgi:uncharacterized protein